MRVEIDGVEEFLQPGIVLHGDVAVVHHPFSVAGNAERAPMDE